MLKDLKQNLVDLLTSDTMLTALLASSGAVYHHRPRKPAEFPCLTYFVIERADPGSDGPDRSVVELHLDIWSASADTNDSILAALDALLFYPDCGGELDSDGFRVGTCGRVYAATPDSDVRDTSGSDIQRMETIWRMTLLKAGI